MPVNTRSLALAAALTLASGVAAAQQPDLDAQFIDSAEYFIAEREPEGAYQYVTLARMLTPATAQTRGEAQFLVVASGAGFTTGQRVWTSHYWLTRVARPEDIALGKMVFVLDMQEREVYRSPRSREEALGSAWWMATITDLSYRYRNEVRAGDYRIDLGAMRVVR